MQATQDTYNLGYFPQTPNTGKPIVQLQTAQHLGIICKDK